MRGFVPMRGTAECKQRLVVLHDAGDEQVALRLDDGPDPDAAVAAALRGPAWQAWSGFQAGPGTPFDDLDLWLATALPGYAVLAATRQARDRGIVASSSPVGISAGQAGSARPGGTGQARPVRLRTAGPGAMDPGIHLAGAARQRDGYPNPHLFSAMDPGTHRGVRPMDPGMHRGVRPRWARWIRGKRRDKPAWRRRWKSSTSKG